MDYGRYADLFYGNGEVDHFPEEGLASKWFYIKALCGNTTPHAVLPFGRMSVGAYSGGYSSGYGTHMPNYCGGVPKFDSVHRIRGFSHLHHSGTGGIRYYYNYAIVTPFYGDVSGICKTHELKEERAVPGYYTAQMNGIRCEVTVTHDTALHRYRFSEKGGRVAVDFSNDGLLREMGESFYGLVQEGKMETSSGKVFFSGVLSGIKLYFCAAAEGSRVSLFADNKQVEGNALTVTDNTKNFGCVFDFEGDELLLRVSYSTKDRQSAEANIAAASDSFEETAAAAYDIWNEHLSAIQIETEDEELKEKFYSNFYHSLIKPCDMTGEEVLGIKGELVTEFITFWDQYKTQLPLVLMLYPDISRKIVSGIRSISRSLGRIPCSLGLTDIFPCEEQAKMLGIYTLCDAYHYGIDNAVPEVIDECIKRELDREDFATFIKDGVFERYTHILDTTDICLDAAEITEDAELKEQLCRLAKNWVNAYDEDSYMSERSPYYEGDRYTYSFRLQRNMEERIALVGGKERFLEMLDAFFGFGKESVKQLTYIGAGDEINNAKHHRFEGFNNECDMETPYAYIYAGRHDRLCDIIHTSIYQTFTTGKGALPGNNDSGGLSSCFMWNVLGIFPVSGSGEFLIGSPHIKGAVIALSNGNRLEIEVKNLTEENYYVDTVSFNGREITDYRISARELFEGGKLVFEMRGH